MDARDVLKLSLKAIKFQLRKSEDIVAYLNDERILKRDIRDVFEDVSEELQCRIAYLHLDSNLDSYGSEILHDMKKEQSFSLDLFFSKIFVQLFPAKNTALYVQYRDLSQGEESVVDFARTLRTLCKEMGIPIETQTFKFVLGLKDKDVRDAILRSDMASYNFQGPFDFAVSLGCSLSFCVKGREGEVEAGLVQVSKQYYKIAKEKGVKKGVCYNCLEGFHSCAICPFKTCKFCKKKNSVVKHFSLKCPLCPRKV